jgi:hypothetical protein
MLPVDSELHLALKTESRPVGARPNQVPLHKRRGFRRGQLGSRSDGPRFHHNRGLAGVDRLHMSVTSASDLQFHQGWHAFR